MADNDSAPRAQTCDLDHCMSLAKWRVAVRDRSTGRRSEGVPVCGRHVVLILEGTHDGIGPHNDLDVLVDRL